MKKSLELKKIMLDIDKQTTTILKGIAILLVLLTHYPKNAITKTLFNGLGGWGVSLFLFLSGYGLFISYNKSGLKEYWNKKFKKIYIPFIVAMLIQIVVQIIIFKPDFEFKTLLSSLLGVNPSNVIDGSMWYIPYLIIWYFIFFVIYTLKIPEKFKLILLILSATLVHYISSFQIFYAGGATLYTLIFPLGVLYGYIKNIGVKTNKWIVLLLFIFFMVLWGYIRTNLNLWNLFFIFVPITFIFLTKSFNLKESKLLNTLGKYSYYIYLFENLAFSIITILPNIEIPILSDIIRIFYLCIIICIFVILIDRVIKVIVKNV